MLSPLILLGMGAWMLYAGLRGLRHLEGPEHSVPAELAASRPLLVWNGVNGPLWLVAGLVQLLVVQDVLGCHPAVRPTLFILIAAASIGFGLWLLLRADSQDLRRLFPSALLDRVPPPLLRLGMGLLIPTIGLGFADALTVVSCGI